MNNNIGNQHQKLSDKQHQLVYNFEKKLKVCVLATTFQALVENINNKQAAENHNEHKIDAHKVLQEMNCDVEFVEVPSNWNKALYEVKRRRKYVDVFVNLYDVEDAAGQAIVQYLYKNGIAFVGSKSLIHPTREELKIVCSSYGIPTSPYLFVYDQSDLKGYAEVGDFPLFVKPDNGYGSVCISESSIINNQKELYERVKYIWNQFGGALIQQFIPGKQLTVLVFGYKNSVKSLRSVQCVMKEKRSILTFQNKWSKDSQYQFILVEDQQLDAKLRDYAQRLYKACQVEGYARLQFRQNKQTKQVYIIDFNQYCTAFVADNFCTFDDILRLNGWSKKRMLKFLVDQAIQRSREFKNAHKQI